MFAFRKNIVCVASSNPNRSTSPDISPKSFASRVAFDVVHCQIHLSPGPSAGGFCAGWSPSPIRAQSVALCQSSYQPR